MVLQKKGVTGLFRSKKTVFQVLLLICGGAMLCYGVLRGEADTVLSKAIRLCLECVGIG
ncbi:CD1871A family CXXC motif-containing protein [Vescimonas sp.]|uniref:CD1871A family CXXC motif-containing protein n=1 Tax=Vescimonas sp. TaxID=2892404 RepID=UPI00307C78EE